MTDFDISLRGKLEAKITFNIPPFPKERPRFRRLGKFIQTYTPAKTTKYEAQIRQIAEKYKEDNNFQMLDCPVELVIVFYLPIPKSAPKKKMKDYLLGLIYPAKKPDKDNLTKSLLDGINKVLLRDDSLVVITHEYKLYTLGREDESRTELYIYSIS